MFPDFDLRDTPAVQAYGRRRASLGHIAPGDLVAAQDVLRAAKRVLGSFAAVFANYGLSPGRYAVLMALDVHGPSLAPSEIADHLNVTRGTVTGLIDGLERDGLVTHKADTGDRRRKVISLTPAGDRLIDRALPDIFGRMADLTQPLTPEERRTLVSLLGKIEDRLASTPPVASEMETSA